MQEEVELSNRQKEDDPNEGIGNGPVYEEDIVQEAKMKVQFGGTNTPPA